MKTKLSTLLFALCASTASFSQQDPLHSMFQTLLPFYNPATSGVQYTHEATVNYRDQWIGISGAPRTLTAQYSTCLANHHGLGVSYLYDKIGFSTIQNAQVNYNYQFRIKDEHVLTPGVSVGLLNYLLNPVWVQPTNSPDPLLTTRSNGTDFDASLGLSYRFRGLLTGISVRHLVPSSSHAPDENGATYSSAIHYYFHASYKQRLDKNEQFFIEPQLMARMDASKMSSVDAVLKASWRDQVWLGLVYRSVRAYGIQAGWNILGKYRLAYALEIDPGLLNNGYTYTHEVALGVQFGKRN